MWSRLVRWGFLGRWARRDSGNGGDGQGKNLAERSLKGSGAGFADGAKECAVCDSLISSCPTSMLASPDSVVGRSRTKSTLLAVRRKYRGHGTNGVAHPMAGYREGEATQRSQYNAMRWPEV